MFFQPPYERLPRIPITIGMLHEFAEQKHWGIQYPEHHLPKRRLDLLAGQLFALIVLSVLG